MNPTVVHSAARREYKYRVPSFTADAVRAAIRPFCALDPYAAASPEGRYSIHSLYLDSVDLRCWRDTRDERNVRFKLRVRTYPDSPGSPAFLEVKSREGDAIVKSRGRVPAVDVRAVAAGDATAMAALTAADRGAVDRFLLHHATLRARPVVHVRYQREAWVAHHGSAVRVTFDTRIMAAPTSAFAGPDETLPANAPWRLCDGAPATGMPFVVVELKFPRHAPAWMVGVVEQLDLQRSAFSKYGEGVEALGADGAIAGLRPTMLDLGDRRCAPRLRRFFGGAP